MAANETGGLRSSSIRRAKGLTLGPSLGEVAPLREAFSRTYRPLQTDANVSFFERRVPLHTRNVGPYQPRVIQRLDVRQIAQRV